MTMRTAIDTRAKILMAFWHRGRRQPVPLIAREAAEKAGTSLSCARKTITRLEADGWLSSEMHNSDVKVRIYRLTPKGEAMVTKAIEVRETFGSQRDDRNASRHSARGYRMGAGSEVEIFRVQVAGSKECRSAAKIEGM